MPGLKPEKYKAQYKPAPKQKAVRLIEAWLNYNVADAELTDRLAEGGDHYGRSVTVRFNFEASDTEFFDVHSVASLGNTATLMKAGVRSKEEALRVLNDLYLERLHEDNTEFSDIMMKNRVSVDKYLNFNVEHPYSAEYEPQHYVDAARIYATKSFRRTKTSDGYELYEAVLGGRFTADDLIKIGASRLSNAMEPDRILNALASIKNGTAGYDIDQLKALLEKSANNMNPSTVLELADKYGMEFTLGRSNLWITNAVSQKVSDLPLETQREVLTYVDELRTAVGATMHAMTPSEMVQLFQGDVPPEVVAEHWQQGDLTAQQIIALHRGDTAPSIANGWL